MRHRLFPLARAALFASGLLALAGPLSAQLPEAKFSTTKDQPTKGTLTTGIVSNLGIRPNSEMPYFLFLSNPGAEARTNLKVYITADKSGNQILYSGSVKKLEKNGEEGSNVFVPLTAVKKAPPTNPVLGPDGKALVEQPKTIAPAIPLEFWVHVLKVEGNEERLIQEDQKPSRVQVSLRRPSEYLYVSEERVVYDEATKTYSISLKIGDRFRNTKGGDKATAPFDGNPAKVRLDLRPELIPGLDVDSIRDGTLEAVVEPGQDGYELSVKNIKINGAASPSLLPISVDGYERAFVFSTNMPTTASGTTASAVPVLNPLTRIDLPRYSVPGRPLTAKLEVFGEHEKLIPEFKFFRTEKGEPELLSREMKGSRKVHIGGEISETGDLLLSSVVQDWSVPINTRGIVGDRSFTLTLKGGAETPASAKLPLKLQSSHLITLDATPPEPVEGKEIGLYALPQPKPKPPAPPKEDDDECIKKEEARQEKKELLEKLKKEGCEPPPGAVIELPKKPGDESAMTPEQKAAKAKVEAEEQQKLLIPGALYAKILVGKQLTLVTQTLDKESLIDKVYFFVGAPPGADNKSTKDSKVYEGKPYNPFPSDPKKTAEAPSLNLYAVTIEMPDKPGTVEFGVRVINKAGLVSEKTGEIKVVEPDPPPKPKEKPTTGTITGKVAQGDRPQRGLEVKLFNQKAEVVMQTETDENGEFQFCKVPPGSYRVHAVKQSDNGAKDTKSVVLKAGKTEKTELNLLRRP